jgi:hypothetical protein
MNNRENQTEQQEKMPTMAIDQQADTVASSRRRLLRAGLKAAPVVVATLAARPSLACHCVLPSAWGSINAALGGKQQDMGAQTTIDNVNNFTGSMARYKNSIIENFPSLKFSDFLSNDNGWSALSTKFTANNLFPSIQNHVWDDSKKVDYLKGNYPTDKNPVPNLPKLKTGVLCQKMGCVTPSGSDNAKPYSLINNKGFGGSMLIAQINMYLGGRLPPECITKLMLDTMASGSYTAPQTSVNWGKTEIKNYLHNNWIARRDA